MTSQSRTLIDQIGASSRAEARAAGARLVAIGELFALRMAQCGESAEWAVDTWAAVGAEVAAALRVSLAMAGSYLHYALALRDRLPRVGALLCAGDIDVGTFRVIVYRTMLITDPAALAAVDAALATGVPRWGSLSQGKLAAAIDAIVAHADPDAPRRVRQASRDRDVSIWDDDDGLAGVSARLFATDAAALDKRLDALAASVCAADPRTRAQRRADALGVLAAGAQRLACGCARRDCPAAGPARPPSTVIHVVAEQATVDGAARTPGYLLNTGASLPAEVIAELAPTATQRPLIHPLDAPPEPGYVPSAALADFVRARDLTCRAPGCDTPASACDIDHTIAWADGGPTHASNLACHCRTHHLLKTFWGWQVRQLPDGTLIWTLPSGQTYVTTPGSALLFPALMTPTGALNTPRAPQDRRADKTAKMPRRTRRQNRAAHIAAERNHNRQRRQARRAAIDRLFDAPPPPEDAQPPPF